MAVLFLCPGELSRIDQNRIANLNPQLQCLFFHCHIAPFSMLCSFLCHDHCAPVGPTFSLSPVCSVWELSSSRCLLSMAFVMLY